MLFRLPKRKDRLDMSKKDARENSDVVLFLFDNMMDDVMTTTATKGINKIRLMRVNRTNKVPIRKMESDLEETLRNMQNFRDKVHNFLHNDFNSEKPIKTYEDWVKVFQTVAVLARGESAYLSPLRFAQKTTKQLRSQCRDKPADADHCKTPCYISKASMPPRCYFDPEKIKVSLDSMPVLLTDALFKQYAGHLSGMRKASSTISQKKQQSNIVIRPKKEMLTSLQKVLHILINMFKTMDAKEIKQAGSDFKNLFHTFLFELPVLSLEEVGLLRPLWNKLVRTIMEDENIEKKRSALRIIKTITRFYTDSPEYDDAINILLPRECFEHTLHGKAHTPNISVQSRFQKQWKSCPRQQQQTVQKPTASSVLPSSSTRRRSSNPTKKPRAPSAAAANHVPSDVSRYRGRKYIRASAIPPAAA